MDNRFDFRKAERISGQKEIECLFKQGNTFISYPLRIIYVNREPLSGSTAAILVSVPKKKFKHAVKRNRMKRLIREAYRLNKAALIRHCREKETGLLIAFLFIGNELCHWEEMEVAMKKALDTLIEKSE